MSATELDPVIHASARLRIMAAMAAMPPGDAITFPRLQELLEMTAGNLTTHLRKLEEAGYVALEKTFSGRKPVTFVTLPLAGRQAFDAYTAALRELLGGTT